VNQKYQQFQQATGQVHTSMLPPSIPHIKRSAEPYFVPSKDGSGHVIINESMANAGISSQVRASKISKPPVPAVFAGSDGNAVVMPVPGAIPSIEEQRFAIARTSTAAERRRSGAVVTGQDPDQITFQKRVLNPGHFDLNGIIDLDEDRKGYPDRYRPTATDFRTLHGASHNPNNSITSPVLHSTPTLVQSPNLVAPPVSPPLNVPHAPQPYAATQPPASTVQD